MKTYLMLCAVTVSTCSAPMSLAQPEPDSCEQHSNFLPTADDATAGLVKSNVVWIPPESGNPGRYEWRTSVALGSQPEDRIPFLRRDYPVAGWPAFGRLIGTQHSTLGNAVPGEPMITGLVRQDGWQLDLLGNWVGGSAAGTTGLPPVAGMPSDAGGWTAGPLGGLGTVGGFDGVTAFAQSVDARNQIGALSVTGPACRVLPRPQAPATTRRAT